MKKILMLIVVAFAAVSSFAGTTILEGKYQNKNIFVINSLSSTGVGFCVYEVRVNGQVSTDETNSSAFEVDLSVYGFVVGDDVSIAIKYKEDCEPRVLNPGALEPQPTFEILNIDLTNSGVLSWKTKNEQGKVPYIVQQYKWNKWVDIGEVQGQGKVNDNMYNFNVNLTSGENKVRVMQKGYGGKAKKSPVAMLDNDDVPVNYQWNKKTKTISFSQETGFELYNEYGQIIKRGYDIAIDAADLSKGRYYLNLDSRTEVVDL